MATAIYTVRVENGMDGGWFEFEMDVDVFDEDVEDFNTDDQDLYRDVMDNLYVEWDFDRWEDLPEEDDNA